jgi:hypothetical protein
MLGNSRVAERLVPSQEGLGSMELLSKVQSLVHIYEIFPIQQSFTLKTILDRF